MVVGHLAQIARINFQVEVGYLLVPFCIIQYPGQVLQRIITDRIGYFRAMFGALLLLFVR